MILRSMRGAALVAALAVGGCQTGLYGSGPPASTAPATTPMDGTWASTDGVFVAQFERGNFTSRFTATNEILAQGTYSVAGSAINMNWISVATKQQRSASCSFMAADAVTCSQLGGGKFELRRGSGAVPPVGADRPTGPPETVPPARG